MKYSSLTWSPSHETPASGQFSEILGILQDGKIGFKLILEAYSESSQTKP